MGQYTDQAALVHAGETMLSALEELAKRSEPWLTISGDQVADRITRAEAALYSLLQGAVPASTAMAHGLEFDPQNPEKWSVDPKVFYVLARGLGVALAGTLMDEASGLLTIRDMCRMIFEGYAEAIRDQEERRTPLQ